VAGADPAALQSRQKLSQFLITMRTISRRAGNPFRRTLDSIFAELTTAPKIPQHAETQKIWYALVRSVFG
jgi:hypothetical protein